MPGAFAWCLIKKLKKLSYWIRNYFGFSQKEVSGFMVLLILILIFLFLPIIYNYFTTPDYENSSSDKRMLDSLVRVIEEHAEKKTSPLKNKDPLTITAFDPNKTDKNGLLSLGIGSRTAERIINYRMKGGVFRVRKDLLKIYGFPPDLYAKLQQFILLPDSLPLKLKKITPEILSIDINSADTTQLKSLKGIGQVLASRIIKYRNKLGGFISKDQYREVYGLSPLALDELNKQTFIKSDFIPVKININTADKETLSAHPYLSNKMAVIIVNYREQHKSFKSPEGVREIKSMSPEETGKLIPYLAIE
jgi:competence protein ComEA